MGVLKLNSQVAFWKYTKINVSTLLYGRWTWFVVLTVVNVKMGNVYSDLRYEMFLLDYLVVEVIDKDVEEESEVFTKPDAVDASSAFATSVNKRFEEDIGDDTTLMDQYLSKNHESTRLSQVQGDNLQTGAEGSVSKATTTLGTY